MKLLKSRFFSLLSHFTSFHFILFPFLFSLFTFLLLSCSSPTETPTGELSGIVNLEGMQDHSGIVIALYELAYLDTTIVRINNQYPQIGVHINQHTEFDHRLQSPIKSTETLADGSFELTKIPTGTYNLIAMKAGFGFKYLYEITIAESDNELSEFTELTPRSPLLNTIEGKPKTNRLSEKISQRHSTKSLSRSELSELTPQPPLLNTIEGELKTNRLSEEISQRHSTKSLSRSDADITLYEELHISGNIQEDIIVLPDHHLIIDDDTVFVPNTSSLTIEPGAVIRINPAVDLTIHGNLFAQGEEDNMFWITSNDGFENSQLNTRNLTLSNREIGLYNSMELSSIATVGNDLIQWGKWNYANTCLLNKVNNLHMQNGIFRDAGCGFYSSDVDSTFCSNILGENCFNETVISINFVKYGVYQDIISINNNYGIYTSSDEYLTIKNNYFASNNYGVYCSAFHGEIKNNEFHNNFPFDVFCGGGDINFPTTCNISNNEFYSENALQILDLPNSNYHNFSEVNILENNFFSSECFIYYSSDVILQPIFCSENFYNYLQSYEFIFQNIYNTDGESSLDLILEGIQLQPINNIGILQ